MGIQQCLFGMTYTMLVCYDYAEDSNVCGRQKGSVR